LKQFNPDARRPSSRLSRRRVFPGSEVTRQTVWLAV
jgi:hypothetical protein